MSKIKVLAIDDEPGATRMMKINLESLGQYQVEMVNDSTQSIATALRFRPDIILLDMVMPNLDGGDVKRLLQENEELKDIPVLFLTALVSDSDTSSDVSLVESGDGIMIPKPVKTEVLRSCIEQTLSGVL